MPGKSTLTADAAEQAVLRALSKSEQRGESGPVAGDPRPAPGQACMGSLMSSLISSASGILVV